MKITNPHWAWALLAIFLPAFLFLHQALAQLAAPQAGTLGTDSEVDVMEFAPDGSMYIAGGFTRIGPSTGSGVPVNIGTAQQAAQFPKVNGLIKAVVSDNAGGWYIGGNFTKINSLSRPNLAHIKSDGTLDSWAPNPNNQINTLAVKGNILYVGGAFTSVSGQTRNYIAAFDMPSGTLTAWNPDSSKWVGEITATESLVYVGGGFTKIGGQNRTHLAALDPVSAAATHWNPNPDGNDIADILVNGGTIYVAGAFTQIGGQNRNNIAAIDAVTGNALAWNPNASKPVYTLALSGETLYAGGAFTQIGGQTRNGLAAIKLSDATVTSWNPAPTNSNTVYALLVHNDIVYVGGPFQQISGQKTQRYIAAYDLATGSLANWNPFVDGHVQALAAQGNTMYIAGSFSLVGGVPQNRIAHIFADGRLDPNWNPNPNNRINDMALKGSTLYVGGYFSSMGGKFRQGIAALDASTGSLLPWNPTTGGSVHSFEISGSTMFLGGNFASVNEYDRNNIGAIDITTGKTLSWNPDVNGIVEELVVTGGNVYLAGSFTAVGGQTRNYLAQVDAITGNVTSWNPNPNDKIYGIAAAGSSLYVGGKFTQIGGVDRGNLAAVDLKSGKATNWNPDPNHTGISDIATNGSVLYVGGGFNGIAGQKRRGGASFLVSDGSVTSFDPNFDCLGSAYFGTSVNGDLAIGGCFKTSAEEVFSHFIVFRAPKIEFSTSASSGAEATASPVITVTLSEPSTADVIIPYTTSGGSVAGSGVDFTSGSGTVTIPAGQVSATVPLVIVNDNFAEADEEIVVSLKTPVNAALGTQTSYTYTLINDDIYPAVQFPSLKSTGSESVQKVDLEIFLSAATKKDVAVAYAVTGGTAVGSGSDYDLAAGVAKIPAGQTTAIIPLTIVNDTQAEYDETVTVALSNPVNALLGFYRSHTYTIINNDAGKLPTQIPVEQTPPPAPEAPVTNDGFENEEIAQPSGSSGHVSGGGSGVVEYVAVNTVEKKGFKDVDAGTKISKQKLIAIQKIVDLMVEKGTYSLPKSGKFQPNGKTSLIFASQIALALAGKDCGGKTTLSACKQMAVKENIIASADLSKSFVTRLEFFNMLIKAKGLKNVSPARVIGSPKEARLPFPRSSAVLFASRVLDLAAKAGK